MRRRGVPDDGDADGPDGVRLLPPAQYQTAGLRGVSGPFADDAILCRCGRPAPSCRLACLMMPHEWGARLHCVGARLQCVAATPLMAIQRLTRPLVDEIGPHVPRIPRPRPCAGPALRPRGLYHVLVAILTAVAVRERGQIQRRRDAPAAVASSTALRNGRMCTTGMRLAKLHNDTKRNARERNNTKNKQTTEIDAQQ